jgi:hypothetical protein
MSLELLESLDSHAETRNAIRRISEHLGEWAGIPMPLDGESLVVEKNFPNAKKFMKLFGEQDDFVGPPEFKLRSSFYSTAKRCDVHILEVGDGKITWTYTAAIHHFEYDLRTLGCADAWGIEQEGKAVSTLGELVTHRQFKQYMLTGMFLESSRRTGIGYMFRRLKPTVAINTRHPSGKLRIMCALCLHPIAYYTGSWAGAMCPTDDIIAHLMLMRGDEPMFWRRSNQHPAFRPEAGL